MAVHKLHQSLLDALKNDSKVIYFLDLDSTIYDLTNRQLQIFREFSREEKFQKEMPAETKAFSELGREHISFYPQDCLKNFGLKEISEKFENLFFPFWSQRFFSNDYLKYDEAEEGSLNFVKEIVDHGGHIHYLTGRDTERMRQGTIAKLKEDGFFFGEEGDTQQVKLIMKPEKSLDDAQFKHDHMTDTLRKYHKGVLIDNEPANLEIIKHLIDDIHLIHYDSHHMGNLAVPEEALILENFSTWK